MDDVRGDLDEGREGREGVKGEGSGWNEADVEGGMKRWHVVLVHSIWWWWW